MKTHKNFHNRKKVKNGSLYQESEQTRTNTQQNFDLKVVNSALNQIKSNNPNQTQNHSGNDPKPVIASQANVSEKRNQALLEQLNQIVQYEQALQAFYCAEIRPESNSFDPTQEEVINFQSITDIPQPSNDLPEWGQCFKNLQKWWITISRLRTLLLNGYQKVILYFPEYSCENQLEQSLWKFVFYNILEVLRSRIEQPSSMGLIPEVGTSEMVRRKLCENLKRALVSLSIHEVIEPGILFFNRLILAIQQRRQINFGPMLKLTQTNNCSDIGPFPILDMHSFQRRISQIDIHRLMLCLGDLYRYRSLIIGSNNFSSAFGMYQRAQMLFPKSGRPYCQIALLSLYKKRNFDAVFYYIKSVSTTNSSPTTYQSLSLLFNQINQSAEKLISAHFARNKFHYSRDHHHHHHHNSQHPGVLGSNQTNFSRKDLCRRAERWIHPLDNTITVVKGNRQLHKELKMINKKSLALNLPASSDNDSDDEEDSFDEVTNYKNLPLVELSKKFSVFFYSLHGKLYTKIGMENFPELASLTLQSLSGLLNHEPCPCDSGRLCRLTMINMFSVERAHSMNSNACSSQRKMNIDNNDTLRSVLHDYASRLSIDFFSVLAKRSAYLIERHLESILETPQGEYELTNCLLSYTLRQMLPAIRLFCEWLILHPEHWLPPPNHLDPLLKPRLNEWKIISKLCTVAYKYLELVEERFPFLINIDPNVCLPANQEGISTQSFYSQLLDEEPDGLALQKIIYPSLKDVQMPASSKVLIRDSEIASAIKVHADLKHKNQELIHLFEDFMIFGFNPMLEFEPQFYNIPKYDPDRVKLTHEEYTELARDCLRLKRVILFGDYLCGIEKPLLTFIEEPSNGCHYEVIQDTFLSLETKKKFTPKKNIHVKEALPTVVSPVKEVAHEDSLEHCNDQEVIRLKQEKAALEKKLSEQNKLEEWRAMVIQEAASDGRRGVEIEVRPIYLFPDTNCYIDWLDGIATITQPSSNYTVFLPLVVLDELENLSKRLNNDNGEATPHDYDIERRAQNAIAWIESQFLRQRKKTHGQSSRIRLITGKGNILDTLSYRHESLTKAEMDSFGAENNDDVILNCVKHMSLKTANPVTIEENKTKPVQIFREVVLLTSDRNLRLKAINQNIPAPLLKSFVAWSGLPIVKLGYESTLINASSASSNSKSELQSLTDPSQTSIASMNEGYSDNLHFPKLSDVI